MNSRGVLMNCRVFSASLMSSVFAAGCLFAASPAFAADPAVQEGPSAFVWSGAYVGVQLGNQFGGGVTYEDQEPSDFDGPGHPMHDKVKGWLGGVHVGYNQQFGNFVVGGEAAIDIGGQDAHRLEVPANQYIVDTDVNFMGSAAARGGIALDRFLVFGKAGVAYVNYDYSASFQPAPTERSNNFNDFGVVFGGGVDYALTDRITVGLEFERYEFGSQTDAIARAPGTTCCGDDVLKADFNASVVKARVGLRF